MARRRRLARLQSVVATQQTGRRDQQHREQHPRAAADVFAKATPTATLTLPNSNSNNSSNRSKSQSCSLSLSACCCVSCFDPPPRWLPNKKARVTCGWLWPSPAAAAAAAAAAAGPSGKGVLSSSRESNTPPNDRLSPPTSSPSHLDCDPYMSQIWCAANSGNVSQLRVLLPSASALELEWTDAMGRTPLIEAAKYNHLDCVVELLRYGANPHHESFAGDALAHATTPEIKQLIAAATYPRPKPSPPKNAPALAPATAPAQAQASVSTGAGTGHCENGSSIVCRYWKRGHCKYSDSCWFSHQADLQSHPDPPAALRMVDAGRCRSKSSSDESGTDCSSLEPVPSVMQTRHPASNNRISPTGHPNKASQSSHNLKISTAVVRTGNSPSPPTSACTVSPSAHPDGSTGTSRSPTSPRPSKHSAPNVAANQSSFAALNKTGSGVFHSTTICRYWLTGTCTRGPECRFLHGKGPAPPGVTPRPQKSGSAHGIHGVHSSQHSPPHYPYPHHPSLPSGAIQNGRQTSSRHNYGETGSAWPSNPSSADVPYSAGAAVYQFGGPSSACFRPGAMAPLSPAVLPTGYGSEEVHSPVHVSSFHMPGAELGHGRESLRDWNATQMNVSVSPFAQASKSGFGRCYQTPDAAHALYATPRTGSPRHR